MILQNIKKKKGFVILFAVTISSILLAIALGVSSIALKEVKFGTSAKDTDNAFFAADVGVECALIHDKTASSIFVSSSSPQMTCNGVSSINATESPTSFWTFVISGIGESNQSCARVTVDKRSSPTTTVISKGYNTGDASCSSSNPDRIEREIKTSYVGGGLPPPIIMPTSHFAYDTGGTLDNGLVSYWKLDEASGTRVDSKGGINLTNGFMVTQIPGQKVGNSAGFSGSPILQSSSSTLQTGDTSFTFAGWFQMSVISYIQMPFGKTSGTYSQKEYRLQFHTSRNFDFEVYRPGGPSSVTSSVPIARGVWYFVVMWHDAVNNIVGISVNDTTTTSATGGNLQPASNAPFTLGTALSTTYDMSGRIDELGFWNRVLTAQERTDLYNGGTGNTYNP